MILQIDKDGGQAGLQEGMPSSTYVSRIVPLIWQGIRPTMILAGTTASHRADSQALMAAPTVRRDHLRVYGRIVRPYGVLCDQLGQQEPVPGPLACVANSVVPTPLPFRGILGSTVFLAR